MAEFYTWRLGEHSLLTVLLILCVLSETPAMVLSHYRRPHSRVRVFENLLELFILLHIIVLSLLQGRAMNAHPGGILYRAGYEDLRYLAVGVVVLIVLCACIVASHTKKARLLPVIVFACLTAPAIEAAAGVIFAWLYIAALLFWLLRGVLVSILRYREINAGISSVSVKNTIDSMHTGVLFSALDGHILLLNERMSELMSVLTGSVHRNANRFNEALMSGEVKDGCSGTEYNGQVVCRLPDMTAWIFSKTELHLKNKTYIQLTADDITERWALTEQLRQQEAQFKLRSDELRDMIANLHILSREEELHNTKLRAHDILGGWLTMLLHAIRNGQELDLDMLRSQSQNLPHSLKTGQSAASPNDRLDSLRRSFETIGVGIQLDGELPGDVIKGRLLMDVIGEGVINAVRHGFATEVYVRIERINADWRMEITDNGRPPMRPIIEGGGIGGLKRKLEPQGGELKICADPRFVLLVVLPGGVADG